VSRTERGEHRDSHPHGRLLAAAVILALLILFLRPIIVPYGDGPGARSAGNDASGGSPEVTSIFGGKSKRVPTAEAARRRAISARKNAAAIDDGEVFPETLAVEDHDPFEAARAAGTGSLVGWVTDEQGLPIADAKVTAQFLSPGDEDIPPDDKPAKRPTEVSYSDGAGNFAIEDIPIGKWMLSASIDGYGDAGMAPVLVPLGRRSEPQRLLLTRGVAANGKVLTATGTPIVGADLSFTKSVLVINELGLPRSLAMTIGEKVTTDSAGAFRIENLPPGEVRVLAVASGFADELVVSTLDKSSRAIDIRMKPEAPFEGIVRDLRNNLIGQAKVTARSAIGEPTRESKCTTTSDGRFALANLPAGLDVDVRVEAKGFARMGPLRLITGTKQNVIVLGEGGQIDGLVRDLDSKSPEAGILVVARATGAPGSSAWSTESRSDGRYRLQRLPPGEYEIDVRDERLVSSAHRTLRVAEGERAKDINFEVYEGLSVRGLVLEEGTGQAIPGAFVRLVDGPGRAKSTAKPRAAVADATGSFEFRNVPEGRFTLTAKADGFSTSGESGTDVKIALTRRVPPVPLTIALTRGGRIEGDVRFVAGGGAANSLVEFRLSDGTAPEWLSKLTTTTDTTGHFMVEGIVIRAGQEISTLATTESGLKGTSRPFTMHALQPEVWTEVVLERGVEVTVRAKSPSGGALSGAEILLGHEAYAGTVVPPTWKALTDTSGLATFEHIPEGIINIAAMRPGYAKAARRVQVPRSQTIELELSPAFAIAGLIEDGLGQVIADAQLSSSLANRIEVQATTTSRPNGTFRLEGLTAGKHTLTVSAPAPDGRRVTHLFPGITSGTESNLKLIVPMNGSVAGSVDVRGADDALAGFRVTLNPIPSREFPNTVGETISREFQNGEFRFEGVVSGLYSVTVSATGFLPSTSDEFVVLSPEETRVEDIDLRQGGRIRMRVVDEDSLRGIPRAFAQVVESGDSAHSDSSGNFVLGPLEPGVWTVRVTHAEYLPTERHLIKVVAGRERNEGKLRMERGAELNGVVKNARGRAVEGAVIDVRTDDSELRESAISDADGKFRFTGLRPGTAIATASARVGRSMVTQNSTVALYQDKPADLEFVLAAESRIEGRLLGPPGTDISRAIVDLYPLEPDSTPRLNDVIPARRVAGGYEADELAEGDYLVTVRAPLGSKEAAWFEVARVRGALTIVDVVSGSQALSGRVMESADGPPLVGQQVRLGLLTSPQSGFERLSRWWRFMARTDGAGYYGFTNLPSGRYDYVAPNPSYPHDVLGILSLYDENAPQRLDLHFLPEAGTSQ